MQPPRLLKEDETMNKKYNPGFQVKKKNPTTNKVRVNNITLPQCLESHRPSAVRLMIITAKTINSFSFKYVFPFF